MLDAGRVSLKAEDLVWDDRSANAPPLAPGSMSNLSEHMNVSAPDLAADRNASQFESSSSGLAPGVGPMIVEPDFSGMEKGLDRNLAGNQLAKVVRNPAPSPDTQSGSYQILPGNPVASDQSPPGLADSFDNGQTTVLAKPALPAPGVTTHGLAPISSRVASAIDLNAGGFRMHVVRPGESLQSLSREYFGNPDYYLDIYVANQDVLTSPGAVRNGMSLRIPLADR